jgi:hypothetical protein
VSGTTRRQGFARALATRWQQDTATIRRKTLADDSMGGRTTTWSTASTPTVSVHPSGQTPDEKVIADRLGVVSFWWLSFPAQTDVRASDRIVVGSVTYEVVEPLGPRSFEVRRKVACKKIS